MNFFKNKEEKIKTYKPSWEIFLTHKNCSTYFIFVFEDEKSAMSKFEYLFKKIKLKKPFKFNYEKIKYIFIPENIRAIEFNMTLKGGK